MIKEFCDICSREITEDNCIPKKFISDFTDNIVIILSKMIIIYGDTYNKNFCYSCFRNELLDAIQAIDDEYDKEGIIPNG